MSTPSSAASPAPSSSSSSCCLLPLSCHLPVLDRSIKFYKLLIRLGVCVCVCVDPYYITRCVYTLWAHAPLLLFSSVCFLLCLCLYLYLCFCCLCLRFLFFCWFFVLLFLLMLRYLLYFIYYLDIAQPSFTSTMQSRRVCSLICLLTFLTPTPTLTLTSTLT